MAKENRVKMKRKPTIWENIFANDTSDKSFISKIYIQNSYDSTPARQTIQLKMGKGFEQTLLQGRHPEGPETYEKMLSIATYQRDAN